MTPHPPSRPLPRLVAGRYQLLELIGAGGMGVVHRGFDERLQREVAVKLVDRDDPGLADRLRREAELLAGLNHPHIVHIFDAGEEDGRPYIVTSLVEGESLCERLRRGPLSSDATAALGRQVADALAAAHRCGIVHRDLKPDNIIVSADGFARLLDFGIAQRAGDTALTAPGSVIGTAAYLSPEQLHGHGAAPPSDVYALGLVLLECLTGRPAFPGTPSEAVGARLVGAPPMPTSIGPRWRALLEAMTDRAADARPTAADVVGRLDAINGPSGAPAPPLATTTAMAVTAAPPDTPAPPAAGAPTSVMPVTGGAASAPIAPGTTGVLPATADHAVAGSAGTRTGRGAEGLVSPTAVLPAATALDPARTTPGGRRRLGVVLAALAVLAILAAVTLLPRASRLLTGETTTDPTTTLTTTVTTVPGAAAPTTTDTTARPTATPAPTTPTTKADGKGKPGKGKDDKDD